MNGPLSVQWISGGAGKQRRDLFGVHTVCIVELRLRRLLSAATDNAGGLLAAELRCSNHTGPGWSGRDPITGHLSLRGRGGGGREGGTGAACELTVSLPISHTHTHRKNKREA